MLLNWYRIDIYLENTKIFEGYAKFHTNNIVKELYHINDSDYSDNLIETQTINPEIWNTADNAYSFPVNNELNMFKYEDIISNNIYFNDTPNSTEYDGIISSNGIYTQSGWDTNEIPTTYYIPVTINLTSIASPLSDICFPSGVPISCDQGNIPIQLINPYIHTINNKNIVGVVKTISKDKHLICFEKDSLGPNIPSQKTIISNNHIIYYNGVMKEAVKFVGMNDNIYRKKYKGETLYNVLMERHDKMYVNNLLCETLHPNNRISELHRCLQLLKPGQQDELIKLYNEHIVKNTMLSQKINNKCK